MELPALVRAELLSPPPALPESLVSVIRERFGDALDALLFYGSCLRNGGSDGVLDFYAIVDDYARVYDSRVLALANRALPPNVFYLDTGAARAKVAVLSSRDFARGAGPAAIRPALWARFCQPFALIGARDAAVRERVAATATTAIRTAVTRGLGLLPAHDDCVRFRSSQLWTELFRETYRSELRTERDHAPEGLYASAPGRYERVLRAALDELAREERAEVERGADGYVVRRAPDLLSRPRRGRRIAAKSLGAVQLVKSALTFGDWLPYALWKLERHTGTRLEPSERQRRHPFLFAWPLFFQVLARRDLR